MDYERTVQLYEKAGQIKKWEDTPEYHSRKGELDWYDKVKSKRSGDFWQAQDLINRQLVDPEWEAPHKDKDGKPLEYPVKYVNSIIKIRAADGSKWLKSRQQWWGLDEAGNPINQTMDDKEVFDDVLMIYTLKPENPKARDSKMIREVTGVTSRIKYTLPFTKENAEKLWNMRNGNCSLVIKDESGGGDKSPRSVESFEQFASTLFSELWDLMTTPKWKLDRSYKDQLNDTQYG